MAAQNFVGAARRATGNASRISCAETPTYIGSISGCTIEIEPSKARVSLHDSKKCVAGTCQCEWREVSLKKTLWCTRNFTLLNASAKLKSAGAS